VFFRHLQARDFEAEIEVGLRQNLELLAEKLFIYSAFSVNRVSAILNART
jgi:hypothetical protein